MHISFANPFWLWGLLVIPLGFGLTLLWGRVARANFNALYNFIDQKLLPHVLLGANHGTKPKYIGGLYALLVFFIIIALANPRWSYKDIDAFQPTASMVIVLDLNASMNATDVTPSRIARARQYIEDLLTLSHGLKIGIIGFAGYPHLISPITDDLQTIKTYVPALDTDLTNRQGDSLVPSIKMASDLLQAEPGNKKSILLLSDGNFANHDVAGMLPDIDTKGIMLHVVGVGTSAGAPYKNNNGALRKAQGKVVTSKLNSTVLKELAKEGHGIYTEATHSEVGLRAILAKAEQRDQEHIIAGKVRQWDDRYYLFLLPAAMILLYLIRTRILYLFVILVVGGWLSPPLRANSFTDLFLNADQKGQQFYIEGNFKDAANAFSDPYHKGVALYRDAEYAQAEQEFAKVTRSNVKLDAMYNAGNACMQQQKWQNAINHYEAVLEADPDHFAAAHNLEIARKMLAKNPPEKQNDDCKNCNNKDKEGSQEQSKQNSDNAEQSKQDKSQAQNEQKNENNAKHNEQEAQDTKAAKNEQSGNNPDKGQEERAANQLHLDPEDEARIAQWLNRVDSDIKIFLKNKFYVEDMLSEQ